MNNIKILGKGIKIKKIFREDVCQNSFLKFMRKELKLSLPQILNLVMKLNCEN